VNAIKQQQVMESMDDDESMESILNSTMCREDSILQDEIGIQDESGIENFFCEPETFSLPEQQFNSALNNLNGSFKRSEPPTMMSPSQPKRYKLDLEPMTLQPFQERLNLQSSMSMDDILTVVERSEFDRNLIGDFSKSHALPLVQGNHPDLKSISAGTMRELLLGKFDDRVASFKIIDCRYDYEFEGGHIKGAVNLFTREQILAELNKEPEESRADGKRHILIFHCEFSSKRGPELLVEVKPKLPALTAKSHLLSADQRNFAQKTEKSTNTSTPLSSILRCTCCMVATRSSSRQTAISALQAPTDR
jgi:hypothetical protein